MTDGLRWFKEFGKYSSHYSEIGVRPTRFGLAGYYIGLAISFRSLSVLAKKLFKI